MLKLETVSVQLLLCRCCSRQLVYLVVRAVHGEVSHTDDDFMQHLFGGMLGAVPEQRADDMAERKRQALGS